MNESKEHIITVSSKLFLQKSFKEVTMREIVDKTGLSKGAFYHYFESKEQLFLEVLDFFFSNVMKHDYESYSKGSFYEFYHAYVNGSVELNKIYLSKFKGVDESESKFNMNYFTLILDALKLFPNFREKVVESYNNELEIWVKVIKKSRIAGEIKSKMTDYEVAKLFLYLSDGVSMHLILRGGEVKKMVGNYIVLWDRLYDTIKV